MTDIHFSSTPSQPWWSQLRAGRVGRALSEPVTLLGVILVTIHLLMAIFAQAISPHSVSALVGTPMQTPNVEFWLGTDQIGRDYLSRLLAGGQVALLVASCGIVIAVAVGTALGIVAGYLGGHTDEIIMRGVDTMMSVPELILIAILTLAIGSDLSSLILVVAVTYFAGVVRVVRARTVMLSTQDFVRAAELRGEKRLAIMFRELLPNLVGLLGIELAVRMSSAILKISALSFLGLGVSQPTPDWGLMVQEAMGVVYTDPWFLMLPAAALASLILGINFAVDGFTRAFGISTSEL
ncbi:MAG: ABC transporter permease [Hyphomicrobiales bacterium]|nr:MAG: ABC transporter permease [Hyphomicrobiales bacterium]